MKVEAIGPSRSSGVFEPAHPIAQTKDGIKSVDPRNEADIEIAARLHRELLPDSPISLLGEAFMRQFYYRKLIADGLVHCDIYYDHGTPAGFIAYTSHSSDFMRWGLRRHWPHLGILLSISILRDSTRLRSLLLASALMRKRREEKSDAARGEILSLGVAPDYRGSQYVRRTGRRISLELIEHAREYFRGEKVPTFRAFVQARNAEALFLYGVLGCQFRKDSDGKVFEVTCAV